MMEEAEKAEVGEEEDDDEEREEEDSFIPFPFPLLQSEARIGEEAAPMTEEKREIVPPKYDIDAKWDECVDLTVRRFVYSSLSGAFGGLLLFRSPVSRWAAVAFGAGIGLGSAYTECSQKFDGFPTKFMAHARKVSATAASETVSESPASQEAQE